MEQCVLNPAMGPLRWTRGLLQTIGSKGWLLIPVVIAVNPSMLLLLLEHCKAGAHRACSVPLGMFTEPELDRKWARVKYTRSTIASVLLSHGLLKLWQQARRCTSESLLLHCLSPHRCFWGTNV
jgi:hypothetical protein